MSNVPVVAFTDRGFVAPSEQAVLAGVIADNQEIFGGDLNPALNTPQGQLASTETAVIGQANATFVFYTNMVDPAFAAGRMQDALGRIYFIARNPAQATVVSALCTGAVDVEIPAGALARAADGNLYTCIDGGIIGGGGTITLAFACNLVGPIACPAGQLNEIARVIPGWDSITNAADGVLGTLTESRAAFEERRRESVAKNARGIIQAIQGAVLGVDGVLDAFSYQNDDDAPVTYRGVSLFAHSIYVAVVGGSDQDIAEAIWRKKAPGAIYNGSTTVIVYDDSPGYSAPLPAYSITFRRPDNIAIKFAISIANSAAVPSDAAVQIKAAIVAAFAGADGGARARIGSTVYASRFIPPLAALGPWVQIISLQVGRISGNANSVSLDIDEAPVTAGTDITVTLV